LKIVWNNNDLNALVQKMNAEPSSWVPIENELSPRAKLLDELQAGGISINLEDVKPGPGGLLSYNGEQVILYIKDTRASKETLKYSPEDSRRFHIAECSTLENMREKGRIERYVVTRKHDGLFLVDWIDFDTGETGEIEAELKVCKNCLSKINYENYKKIKSARNSVWTGFEISSFLRDYSTFFVKLPSRSDKTAPVDKYVEGWADLSKKVKKERVWTCENCQVNLSSNPRLLHTHHKSGVKTDNSDKNLKVLCAICHSKEEFHEHLRVKMTEIQLIKSARVSQGLTI
jgi:hypothetical protein